MSKIISELMVIGEDMENQANQLQKSVTEAIQEVDQAKNSILKYLDNLDRKSIQDVSDINM